jgi:hypothetical protein
MASQENSGEPHLQETDSLESLQQAYQSLRTTVDILIVVIVVLSGSLNIFLLRQVSLVRREVEDRQRFLTDYEHNSVPLMNDFVLKLQAFAKTNPDFAPILAKYWRSTNPPPASQAVPPKKSTP